MINLEPLINGIIKRRKQNPRFVPGYKIQFPEELHRFRSHKWYVIRKDGYMVLPHWWGTHLLTSDAMEYIRSGIYVAIDRKEKHHECQSRNDPERRSRARNTFQLGTNEIRCLPGT